MSGDQRHKKGKGRGRKGGRGRGHQPQQRESVPGGLQQRGGQEQRETAAQPWQQPQQRAQQPREEGQTPSQQAETVGGREQQQQGIPTESHRKQKRKQQRKRSGIGATQPGPSGEHGRAETEESESKTPDSEEQLPRVTEPPRVEPVSTSSDASQAGSPPSQDGTKVKTVPSPSDGRQQSAAQRGEQPGVSATGTKPKVRAQEAQLPAKLGPTPRSDKAEPRLPRRPDSGGKSGRPIRLRVNFLPVKLPEEDIHHYDTEIKAKGVKRGDGYTRKEAPRIIQGMVEQYERANPHGPKLVYDKNGKNLYCKRPIPGIGKDKREYNVTFITDNDKEREYTVTVQWVSQVSLYYLNEALEGRVTEIPRDTLQAVEVVIRHLPSMTNIPVGASFFSYPDGREKDLGLGLQVWNGTFVSIRPTQWKMMLNVDTSSTAFYKAQPVLDFMCEFFRFRDYPRNLDEKQKKKFAKEIKTIRIETTHVKRRQRVTGLSRNSARNEYFDCEGKRVSVFEYFKTKYGITLRYPDLPCLKVGAKGNCVPIELCNIVQGQRKQGKLSAMQTREMIKHTALPAPQRQEKITRLMRGMNYDRDPYCQDFGIRIGTEMVQITGRVLDPPAINYGPEHQPRRETPRDGSWNIPKRLMFQPKELNEWAMVSLQNPRSRSERGPPQFLNDRGMDNFINKLVQAGREKGLRIHPSPCYRGIQRGYEGIGTLFGRLHKDYPNLQLIVVSLPREDDDVYYEHVKHYGDIVYGINTQCIKTQNAASAFDKPRDMDTLTNLSLKINAKLGGTTFVLDKGMRSPILKRPVIIFGADVTHPGAGDSSSPSIAAVVASMDSHPNLYSAEVRVQGHRVEIITELQDMVKSLLKKFRNSTGAKPEKILFYRDGVSEGQFKDVLIHELQAIQRACLELHQSFKPGITFIVVQKRHHARFFAEDPRDQRGKSKNIPAGTVVDKHVCHPFEFDWYLCSHAGIQGTSKPAHYHVLYDDNDFKSDDLQILTNQLCHTYVRCPRTVSIPASAYYAHHVAFRARHHLSDVDRSIGEGSVASGDTGVVLPRDEMINAVRIHERVNSTMYFA